MPFLPVDTAITVTVGPCIDDGDFKSLEDAIAYNAAGMAVDLIKNSGTATTKVDITLTTGGANDWTHKGSAIYEIEITAAQNDTEGTLRVVGVATGVLPFESPVYTVVPVAVYNSLVLGTDLLGVDAQEIESGDATDALAAASVAALVDAHLDHLFKTDTGATLPGATGSVLKDMLEDDAGTWRWNANSLEQGPGGGGAPSAATIADAVWDELATGHVSDGKAGKQLWTQVERVVDMLPSSTYLKGTAEADGGFDSNDKADLQNQANNALVANNLDHLLKVACDIDNIVNNVTDQSVMAALLAIDGDISNYNDNTESLQAMRDAMATALAITGGVTVAEAVVLLQGTPDARTLQAIYDKLDDLFPSGEGGVAGGVSQLDVSDVRTRIMNQLQEVGYTRFTGTMLASWINDGQQEIFARTQLSTTSYTESAVAGTANYTLPNDCLLVTGVLFDGKELTPRTRGQVVNQHGETLDESGTPADFWLHAHTLYLYPIPDGTETITVYAVQLPNEVSADDDVVLLSSQYVTALVDWCCWRAMLADRELGIAANYKMSYEQAVSNIEDILATEGYGGAGTQVEMDDEGL